MYKCSGCGASVKSDQTFCRECGRPVAPAKADTPASCSECGAPLKTEDAFCKECGCPVAPAKTDTTASCSECGAPLTTEDAFCKECGCPVAPAQADTTPSCSKCGTPLKTEDAFCGKCGCPVTPAQADTPLTCKNCGAPLNTDNSFCGKCGSPVGATSTADDDKKKAVCEKTKKAFSIGNIIFLLSMIPANIILISSELFVFKSGKVENNFGFFGFSETLEYINNILNKLESVDGGALNDLRNITSIFSFTYILIIFILICELVTFIIGLTKAKDGVLLKEAYTTATTKIFFSLLFCLLTYLLLLSPINSALENKTLGLLFGDMSITPGPDFAWLVVLAVFDIIVFAVMNAIKKKNETPASTNI